LNITLVASGSRYSRFAKVANRESAAGPTGKPSLVLVRRTTAVQAAPIWKYLGKSFACRDPNCCRGKVLNIVRPATKVVQTLVPSQTPKAERCIMAANGKTPPATAPPETTAAARTKGLFQRLGLTNSTLFVVGAISKVEELDSMVVGGFCFETQPGGGLLKTLYILLQ